MITDELQKELNKNVYSSDGDAANQLILPAKKKQKSEAKTDGNEKSHRQLSKKEQRRYQVLKERLDKQSERASLYQRLSNAALSDEQRKKLRKTSTLGQRINVDSAKHRKVDSDQIDLLGSGSEDEVDRKGNSRVEKLVAPDTLSKPSITGASSGFDFGRFASAPVAVSGSAPASRKGTKLRKKRKKRSSSAIPDQADDNSSDVPPAPSDDRAGQDSKIHEESNEGLDEQKCNQDDEQGSNQDHSEEPDENDAVEGDSVDADPEDQDANDSVEPGATENSDESPSVSDQDHSAEELNSEESNELDEPLKPPPDPSFTTDLFKHGVLQQTGPVLELQLNNMFVVVKRTAEVAAQRKDLPILMEETAIMETIRANDVVIICGETGCGKTTQVPQFLYEAGFGSGRGDYPGMIGVTEPRRVAAVTVAQRVSTELNVPFGREVAYQIRYDANVSSGTKVKFMTDGILQKEIQGDFALRKYSAIILDEAHERNLNTDILIGLLSRIVPLRRNLYEEAKKRKTAPISPLKLIIMSATLRVSDFTANTRLFPKPPPVLQVDARQHPVTVHFSKKTSHDYIDEAFRKICKIHRNLPPGGILVFLTGQQEIETLCSRLRREFPTARSRGSAPPATQPSKQPPAVLQPDQDSDAEEPKLESKKEKQKLAHKSAGKKPKASEGMADEAEESDRETHFSPMIVLPLYSMLSTKHQLRVFEPPPDGTRLVVVATNVAETSITIPGIKYVVDSGRTKERRYDRTTGISRFHVEWTSQASANQRAGRAGRTEAGHAYRLYSSAVFANYFDQHSEPEILRVPIEGTVLQMKSIGIDKVADFPFVTPPEHDALLQAMKTLVYLGALETNEPHRITELGQLLALFPVAPRYAKMLVLAKSKPALIAHAVTLVAAMAAGQDPLLWNSPSTNTNAAEKEASQDQTKERHEKAARSLQKYRSETSDMLSILRAVGAFEYADRTEEFCEKNNLHFKTLKEIHELREQLTNIMLDLEVFSEAQPYLQAQYAKLRPPSPLDELWLQQIIASGLVDRVAKLTPIHPLNPTEKNPSQYAIAMGGPPAFIHPTSFLFKTRPEWVCYQDLISTSKCFMKGITAIQPAWLMKLAPALCHTSKPLENPPPRYDAEGDEIKCFVNVNFGPQHWTLPLQEVPFPTGIDKVKFFARFLLEGQVFPFFLSLRQHLVGKPSSLTTAWGIPKAVALLEALAASEIASKGQLEEQWRKDSSFLLSEVLLWIRPDKHSEVKSHWPPLGKLAIAPNTLVPVKKEEKEEVLYESSSDE